MCDCPAHRALVDCTCACDHTGDRLMQWEARACELEAEVVRLRAGEDPTPHDEGCQLAPGQWIHEFNEVSADKRLTMVRLALDASARAAICDLMDHEGELEQLQIELADWRFARSKLGRWWEWPLVQWWWYRQYKRDNRRALQRETAEIRARAVEEETDRG